MALTTDRLGGPQTLGTGSTDVYVHALSGAGDRTIIKQIVLTNYTSTARTVDLWMSPGGASVADSHRIFKSLALAAYETTLLNLSLVMDTQNDVLRATASAATAINITVSGITVDV